MVDLRRTPSLQHAVALIADSVRGTVRNLELLEAAQINISLNPGRRLFKPLMEGMDVEWAVRQCELAKAHNVKPNVDLVRAFASYAADKSVRWFNECDKYVYPIGSGVGIPVQPAGFWAEGGQPHLLWVQSWKGRTLDPLQKAVLNTVVHKTHFVGDFLAAELVWLDLREQVRGDGRDIEALNAEALGTVSDAELRELMGILLEAFKQYAEGRAARRAEKKAEEKARRSSEGMPLFPDEPPR
jgi:hypothetical protein